MSDHTYAVFLDIDDTLMSRQRIQQKNIDVIAAVRDRGHQVFINTGRSYAAIPENLLQSISFDGIVAGIGSYVRYGNEIIQNITVPPELLNQLTDYFLNAKIPCYFEGDMQVLCMNIDESFAGLQALPINNDRDFTNVYRDLSITKLTLITQLTAAAIEYLNKDFTVLQHASYAEIAMKGCSKSQGMLLLLDHIGFDSKYSLAIGDSSNDLDMLQAAGISVAMANSSDDVKAVCDYVTDDVNDAGVAATLEKFLL